MNPFNLSMLKRGLPFTSFEKRKPKTTRERVEHLFTIFSLLEEYEKGKDFVSKEWIKKNDPANKSDAEVAKIWMRLTKRGPERISFLEDLQGYVKQAHREALQKSKNNEFYQTSISPTD